MSFISNGTKAFIRQTGVDGFVCTGGLNASRPENGWSGYVTRKGDDTQVVLDTGHQYKTKEFAEQGANRLLRAICAKTDEERKEILAEFKADEMLVPAQPAASCYGSDWGTAWGVD